MPIIALSDIGPAALQRFSKIYASSPKGTRLVWDSGPRPWTDPFLDIPLTEDGTVLVEVLGERDLQPIRAKVIEAGGENGLMPLD